MVGSTLLEDIRQVARGRSLLDPAVIQKLMERLRAPARQDPMTKGLTPRELEIIDLIADGCTNRQIGGHLFLAEKTVKNYVTSLLMKLGMERRTQAAVFGSRVRYRRAKGG